MLGSDYRRLGKISIKSRKKSTRNTVTGIVFGLVLLIPIIYFSLAFYLGMTGEINKVKTVSTFSVVSRAEFDPAPPSKEPPRTDDGNYFSSLRIMDYKTVNAFSSSKEVEQSIVYEMYNMSGINSGSELVLSAVASDGIIKRYVPKYSGGGNNSYNSVDPKLFKIIHFDKDGEYILNAEKEDYKQHGDSIFKFGEGFTSATNGKTEIILSEYFCDQFEINPNDIVGKKLSFTFTSPQVVYTDNNVKYVILNAGESYDSTNQSKPKAINYIQDFTVKGIISREYYKLPSTLKEAHVWVSSSSVYTDENYTSLAPKTSFVDNNTDEENSSDKRFVKVSFVNSIADTEAKARQNGLMIPLYGVLAFADINNVVNLNYMTESDNVILPIFTSKMQCKDYTAAAKLGKKIDAGFKTIMQASMSYGNSASYYYANDLYEQFSLINTIGGYVMLVLLAFGGIIFFATMLNLYNSVNYSVQVRKNYMGVMRAIGAKSSMIPKLYFWEIMLIFLRALPWVLAITGLMSFGLKMLIDLAFKYIGETAGIIISLKFWYYFVTLAAVVVVVFIIALAFSQIASKYASKRPILDVLSDDKG